MTLNDIVTVVHAIAGTLLIVAASVMVADAVQGIQRRK